MRPKERRETGEQDLFRARLDQIIDMDHALAKACMRPGMKDSDLRKEVVNQLFDVVPSHPILLAPTSVRRNLRDRFAF